MFTSRELNTFICVAEERSVTKAAERLNITTPAVSCMLRKLEDRLNLNLFSYSNLSMKMTDCGRAIYENVSIHYHALHDIETSLMGDKSVHLMVFLDKDFYFLECTIRHFLSSIGYTATITEKRKSTITYDIEISKVNTNTNVESISFEFVLLSNGGDTGTLVMDRKINKTSYFNLIENEIKSIGISQYLYSDSINEQLEMLNCGLSHLVMPSSGVLSHLMASSFLSKSLIKIDGEVKFNSKNNISENTYTELMSALMATPCHHS